MLIGHDHLCILEIFIVVVVKMILKVKINVDFEFIILSFKHGRIIINKVDIILVSDCSY